MVGYRLGWVGLGLTQVGLGRGWFDSGWVMSYLGWVGLGRVQLRLGLTLFWVGLGLGWVVFDSG